MRRIHVGAVYKHFKGKQYRVLAVGRHTETGEELVLYQGLVDGKLWIRPLEMFMSEVDTKKYPDADQHFRFEELHI